jgi:hypothetical protein
MQPPGYFPEDRQLHVRVYIRQEKRKEIHVPFLESKSTGVEHLKSGQLTVYLWMKQDVGRFCPGKFVPVLMIGGKCSCFRAKAAHFQGIYQEFHPYEENARGAA